MAPALSVRPGRWHSSRSTDLLPAAIVKSRVLEARLFCFCSGCFGFISTDWKFDREMIILVATRVVLVDDVPSFLTDMEFVEEF